MKYILLILISLNCFANFIPKSKFGESENVTVWLNKSKCEKSQPDKCIKIDSTYNYEYSELREFKEVEENSVSCIVDNCEKELKKLKCDEGFKKRKGLISVYCYKAIEEKIVINGAKKIQYDADIARSKIAKNERASAIKELKKSAVNKQWNELSVNEKKILMGMELSNEDLGL